MRFKGWWVDGDAAGVRIAPAVFDDTELSETSGWREAHQNEDAGLPHGYLDLGTAFADARRRLTAR